MIFLVLFGWFIPDAILPWGTEIVSRRMPVGVMVSSVWTRCHAKKKTKWAAGMAFLFQCRTFKKSRQRFLRPSLVWSIMGPPYPGFFLVPTWRIIPASKWLVTSIYKPFRPFVRAFLRDLLTMAINHFMVNSNGVSSPSFWNFLTPEMLVVSSSPIYPSYYWSSKKSRTSGWVVSSMIYRVGNIPGG